MTYAMLATTMQNFTQSLLILLQGMGGIFLFMGLFYGLIVALEKIFQGKKEP
ncbi:MAG TPA: OadG-related small transporter subunit [Candidatus Syntrophosphaera sp.]|jgi:hypothetical protein|nr:MAG: hypothetical protein BWX83_00946 [Candidatus Cloacimonetes bacterium ADurb.Bin117]HNU54358.1 OadG-related small transporter subunit [Candidatus Syntrophosphaera sp.]HOH48028.1 OadG-related small transporter subunit [Candidatus Syntrophosphaera sp.]HPW38281.1 OadG-related small transporter subunit [Candidatus Syntrophosphaera sp.]HPX67245.1 OadG-related small transporter subunit [Candidatus Syntrophosphaera sp.]